jgi:predicted HTH transcriptional regulator
VLSEPHRTEYVKDKPKEFGAVSVKKNSRQGIIIAILKRKKDIMIKDVSSLIPGCSEKTIQRELLAMVQAGVLKKIGEKRWSHYVLA